MLYTLVLLSPCIVCAIWAAALLAVRGKSKAQHILTLIAITMAVYFFANANYVSADADSKSLVISDMVSLYVTLLIPILCGIYIARLCGKETTKWWVHILFIPCLVIGTVGMFLYIQCGIEESGRFFERLNECRGIIPAEYSDNNQFKMLKFFTLDLYNIALLTEIGFLFCGLITLLYRRSVGAKKLFLFFTNRYSTEAVATNSYITMFCLILCGIRLILGRFYMMDHPGVAAAIALLLAIAVFCFFHVGTRFENVRFTIKEFFSAKAMSAGLSGQAVQHKVNDASQTAIEASTAPQEAIQSNAPAEDTDIMNVPVLAAAEQASLLNQFNRYMAEEKPYLNANLTIQDVAGDLHTNRTYISMLVNQNFNSSFRDYINKLRIDEAKRILIKEPDVVLMEVAERSGFGSDSQLVRKFNDIEGLSPRAWEAREREKAWKKASNNQK